MKKFSSLMAVGFLSVIPNIAFGGGLLQGDGDANITTNRIALSLTSITGFINQVLVPAILAVAFLVFVWGMVKYFVIGGADDKSKSDGKSLMLYATAGFVIILIFFGIVNIIANGLGLRNQSLQAPQGQVSY